jgi:Tol biopolymer transport system component/serine/threonine protein kinase
LTPERWAQIEELFHRAAECDSKLRANLLDTACNGDAELRRVVEGLLANEESARDNMHAAVHDGLDAVMFPLIGETVSHYRILEGLGGGGMGSVYRAEDIKLGRQVALKFLPQESIKNPAALSRFEREARSASALEHPNICPIHEFGEHEGQPFLAMQLLKGQTLRELISTADRGGPPLRVHQLLDLAIQIASGLEAAHSQGIIHRDIKPANIFVTAQGQAMILDFGLAKLFRDEAIGDEWERTPLEFATGKEQASTEVDAAARGSLLSFTGAAMGTAGYMSPEQARGEKLDARTDLFSFGAVLYEMATGKIAFGGNTTAIVQEAILSGAPTPLARVNPEVSPELERIVNKAVERERNQRYQSAAEIRTDLQRLKHDSDLGRAPNAASPKERFKRFAQRSGVGLAAAVITLLCAAGMWRLFRKQSESVLPPIEVVPLVSFQGVQVSPAFSRDGSQVAFSQFAGEHPGIYTMLVGGDRPLRLTDNPGDCCPTWSPDSAQIAFVRYRDDEEMSFYVIPALGGTEHRLYTVPANRRATCGGLDWSPDGRLLSFSEPSGMGIHSRVALLSLVDLTVRRLTTPPEQGYDCEPTFSPDGSNVVFTRGSSGGNRRDIFLVPVTGGQPRQLTFGNSGLFPTWTQDGKEIVFASDRGGLTSLWRISAEGGTPQVVAGVGPEAFKPSIPRKGNLLAYQHRVFSNGIWRINLSGETHSKGSPLRVIFSRGMNMRPSVSPDGKKVAFESDRLGYSDIWYCDIDGSNCTQLTSLHGTAGTARWSPDGHYIVFEFQSRKQYQIYTVEVPGGRPRVVPTFPNGDNGAPNWSRDGQWIYFYSTHENGQFQLWKVPFKGGSPVQVTRNGGVYAVESSDGRYIYFWKLDHPGVWKMPLNGGEETLVLDKPHGFDWRGWALASKGIYFLDSSFKPHGRIEYFDFASLHTVPIFVFDKPARGSLTLSTDQKSLLFDQIDSLDFYIMLVKNFH